MFGNFRENRRQKLKKQAEKLLQMSEKKKMPVTRKRKIRRKTLSEVLVMLSTVHIHN